MSHRTTLPAQPVRKRLSRTERRYNRAYRHGVLDTLQLLTGPERATLLRQVFDEKE